MFSTVGTGSSVQEARRFLLTAPSYQWIFPSTNRLSRLSRKLVPRPSSATLMDQRNDCVTLLSLTPCEKFKRNVNWTHPNDRVSCYCLSCVPTLLIFLVLAGGIPRRVNLSMHDSHILTSRPLWTPIQWSEVKVEQARNPDSLTSSSLSDKSALDDHRITKRELFSNNE